MDLNKPNQGIKTNNSSPIKYFLASSSDIRDLGYRIVDAADRHGKKCEGSVKEV